MAVYYTIEINGNQIDDLFHNKIEACLYIRSNQLSNYKVFEKDDSSMKSKREGTAFIFPLAPMNNDITNDIKSILSQYEVNEE